MSWWHYDKKPKRQAVGGIKAKSQRGKIGESWWSDKFIRMLESFDIGARLSRGRSYARSGQVMNLEIESGMVKAKVQGSSYKPYKVRIDIKIFADGEWREIEQAMSEQALFMAKLLSGEMPKEIEEAFMTCQLSLFPHSTHDLETDCSCPDWSNPCKHIAATYYILAEKFDEDPFLIFAWRGRTKEELIENLRKLRSETGTVDGSAEAQLEDFVLVENLKGLGECLHDFWKPAAELAALKIYPQAVEISDAILRQLGPANIEIRGDALTTLLIPAYQSMTVKAAEKALSK